MANTHTIKTSTDQFSCSVMSNSLWPHGLQNARLSCPSPTPRACSNPCPLNCWCHPTISSSVIPFSFCLQSFPASGSFPMSQLFTSGGKSIGIEQEMEEQKDMHSSSPVRTPKLQLAAEQPVKWECWSPPKKDTPCPTAKERSPRKTIGG